MSPGFYCGVETHQNLVGVTLDFQIEFPDLSPNMPRPRRSTARRNFQSPGAIIAPIFIERAAHLAAQ